MDNDTQERGTDATLSIKGFVPYAQIPKWVITHPELSHGAVRLYAVIMTYADNKTRTAFPGREKLADDLGISVATVKRYIKELETAGAMTVTRRRNRKTGNFYANHYILSFEEPNVDISTNSPWVTDDPRRGGVTDDPITIPTMLTTPTSITPQIQESEDRLHLHNKLWSQTKKQSFTKPDPISQEFRQSKERQRIISHIQYMARQRTIGATPDIIDDLAQDLSNYLCEIFQTDDGLNHLIFDRDWIPSATHQDKYNAAKWLNMLLYAWLEYVPGLEYHPIENRAT